ncbi:metalloregulator ArsR/SmtB family transcription factor [Temperatibacter marinus]|uniref:Metalloregulator ArsR/SmtB family transcription factor n=1 Tax=Temperatibacter marinus TaxID=1456591 RepID=A0AA52EGI2_9PROT|nr:metalloregulator ArsR/SmtB family transcription factor [Temperatibacter marinus]WND02112.1 metalloregulator ArsR/SmtB family transcription factor [Temperatibacter marinus]
MSRSDQMKHAAGKAAAIIKLLSHPDRLVLVCSIVEEEKSVSHLVEDLQLRQATVSQHLSKLREADIVKTRKVGQAVFYALKDEKVAALVQTLYEAYCPE